MISPFFLSFLIAGCALLSLGEDCCMCSYNGMDLYLCSEHGKCMYSESGCKCVCDQGWTGEFCQEYNRSSLFLSHRCVAYICQTPPDTYYRCDLSRERCIPDNFNCMMTKFPAKDKDGNLYCPDEDRELCQGMCKCKNPIGWCLPLETH